MSRLKIEVLDAVVDGHAKGAVLEVEAKSAQYLASIGYVRIIESTEAASAPKLRQSKKSEDKSE